MFLNGACFDRKLRLLSENFKVMPQDGEIEKT